MNLLRESVSLLILKLLLIQVVSSNTISFKDGDITYEFDNESKPLGDGFTGTVFKGIRKYGNRIEAVAFKVKHRVLLSDPLKHEYIAYEKVGPHDSIPQLYGYYPETTKVKSIIVSQLLGRNLYDLLKEHNHFSTVTVMRVGIQLLNVLEYVHSKGIIHNEVHIANLAVGYDDDSKVYLFDFGESKEISNIEQGDNKNADLIRLAETLKYMANGSIKEGSIPNHADSKETLELFEYEVLNQKTTIPDYEELKRILGAELEKYKNEPNYEKLDWQIQQ